MLSPGHWAWDLLQVRQLLLTLSHSSSSAEFANWSSKLKAACIFKKNEHRSSGILVFVAPLLRTLPGVPAFLSHLNYHSPECTTGSKNLSFCILLLLWGAQGSMHDSLLCMPDEAENGPKITHWALEGMHLNQSLPSMMYWVICLAWIYEASSEPGAELHIQLLCPQIWHWFCLSTWSTCSVWLLNSAFMPHWKVWCTLLN